MKKPAHAKNANTTNTQLYTNRPALKGKKKKQVSAKHKAGKQKRREMWHAGRTHRSPTVALSVARRNMDKQKKPWGQAN